MLVSPLTSQFGANVEYVKSIETRNFRLIIDNPTPDDKVPNPNDNLKCRIVGKSDDGIKFCASKDCLGMMPREKNQRGPLHLIRAIEGILPVAKNCGFLNDPLVNRNLAARTMTIEPMTPPPMYGPGSAPAGTSSGGPIPNPFDSLGTMADKLPQTPGDKTPTVNPKSPLRQVTGGLSDANLAIDVPDVKK